jgi:Dit-like tail protein
MVNLIWEDDSGAAVTMQFDIDRQEAHEFVTTVTEHPVEVGADVADHVRDELDRFTLEGYVTDSPTNKNNATDEALERLQNVGTIKGVELQIPEKPFLLGVSSAIGAGLNALGGLLSGAVNGPPKANILTFDDFKSRVKIVFDLLDDVRRNHRKVRIVSKVTEYDDMLLEQLTVTRAPDDGTGATFVLAFREIRTVESDITVAPAPAEALGASQKAAGSKSAEDDKELIDGKKKSVAKTIAERTGKYLDENGGPVGALLDAVGF